MGQSLNISGIVTDAVTKAPISGARVKLSISPGEAFTGVDGRYSIQALSIGKSREYLGNAEFNFQYINNELRILARGTDPVSVELDKFNGEKIKPLYSGLLRPGHYTLHNLTSGLPRGVYILKIKHGKNTSMIKMPVLADFTSGPVRLTTAPVAKTAATPLLKINAAALDTARAWAVGYSEVASAVEAATGVLNFSLEKSLWTASAIGLLGTPYNAADDKNGPDSHMSMYGRNPDIMGFPRGDGSVYAAWQDSKGDKIIITRVIYQGGTYVAAEHLVPATLPMLGGFFVSPDQTFYFVSGRWDAALLAMGEGYRAGMLQLHKYNGTTGKQIYTQDVMTGLQAVNGTVLYKPFDAGNGRVVVGGGKICILLAHETLPADGHQLTHYITAHDNTGVIIRDYFGQSHSFDERLLWDGTRFVGYELGDSNIRAVTITAVEATRLQVRPVFDVKGGDATTGGGYNNTFTRLGGFQQGPNGYVMTLAGEMGAKYDSARINMSRNIGLLHVGKNFSAVPQPVKYKIEVVDTKVGNPNTIDAGVAIKDYWGDTYNGVNPGIAQLSNYKNPATEHAERPKLVRIANNVFIVMWEKWSTTAYLETWAVAVDEYGNILVPAKNMGGARLSRGDDLFALNGMAAWFTGGATPSLILYTVNSQLAITKYEIK
jgi:hypothetical protein